MLWRKSKLIRELAAEIQRLRELIARLIGEKEMALKGYEDMREIAAKAIDVAKEKHFPSRCADCGCGIEKRLYLPNKGFICQNCFDPERAATHLEDHMCDIRVRYAADYIAPEVKNCPECNVSVRSDNWPQECPACKRLFGDEEWPDEVG